MKKILLSLLALPLLASAADIYMIGDSTMAYYQDKFHPLAGWGMSMQKHCRRGVTV
ncbi:MAG: GntR family transcriptional regulator, partial [Lentisphaerae bacterium]|nr:GntR family transcriptional regulator [Lentisphaerota bacterium]